MRAVFLHFSLLILTVLASGCGQPEAIKIENLIVKEPTGEDTAVTFEWTGDIDPPMANAFNAAFNEWKDHKERIIIDLHSPGGSVDEGERVIEVINKIKKTHSVQTFVGSGNECLSMCVPIYMQGSLRVAATDSVWMFHEGHLVDSLTGKRRFVYNHESKQAAMETFNRFFTRSKMNKKWVKNLRSKLQYGEVWKSGQDLKDERSNIVMILE